MQAIMRTLAAATATAVLIGGCSSSPSTPTAPTAGPATTTPAATSAPASTAASANAITGTWSGQYSGAYSGTFELTWTQSGTRLTGTINLNPGGEQGINGTVDGSTIKFGTVGSTAIQYTGSIDGTSMSGTYTVHSTQGDAAGNWSATKKP